MIDNFINFLINNLNLTYLILFIGSYFETLIGTSFLIHGEIFFISGGVLAGMGYLNIYVTYLLIITAGFLGDLSSYLIGKYYGISILRRISFLKKYIDTENHNRGIELFSRYGAMSIIMARLMGPLSWFTPFLSGIYKLNIYKFILFDIIGVAIGIGQFILIGYIFGINYKIVLSILEKYAFVFIIVIIVIFTFFIYRHRKTNKIHKNNLLG